MKRQVFAYPYLVWLVILIIAPMLLIAYYALVGQGPSGAQFTLAHLARVFDPMFLKILGNSCFLAFIATLICLLLGYPVAYILSRLKPRTASILYVLFVLPMWMNFLLRTYAWVTLLDNGGLVNALLNLLGFNNVQLLYNEGAVLLGMVYNFVPFMILPIYSVLTKIQRSHIEAAQDLGANGAQVFSRVVFPLSVPGVISGITMVLVPSITTFSISRLLGGAQNMLYGDLIENQFITVSDWNFGSALSVILMVLVFISMAIMRKFEGGAEEVSLW